MNVYKRFTGDLQDKVVRLALGMIVEGKRAIGEID